MALKIAEGLVKYSKKMCVSSGKIPGRFAEVKPEQKPSLSDGSMGFRVFANIVARWRF